MVQRILLSAAVLLGVTSVATARPSTSKRQTVAKAVKLIKAQEKPQVVASAPAAPSLPAREAVPTLAEMELNLEGYQPLSRWRLFTFAGANYMGPTQGDVAGAGGMNYNGGGQAGLVLERGKRWFTFQTGLSYSHTFISTDDQYSGYGSVFKESGEFGYVSLPIGFRFNFSRDSANTFYTRVAAIPAYLAYAKYSVERNGFRVADGYNKDGMSEYDMQAAVGLGAVWNKFVVDASYVRGFIKLNPTRETYNHGGMLSLGYLFDL